MEQLLALDMVRVTEAAALASARSMGRGEGRGRPARDRGHAPDDGRDRDARHHRHRRGRARRGADALDRRAGRPAGGPDALVIDIAVDPLEGTNLVAHGQADAITVLAASEEGGLLHAPDTYLDKLCVGPAAAGNVDIRRAPRRTCAPSRSALRRDDRRHHLVILERPRHEALIAEVRDAGPASSSSPTATSRRPSAAPSRARACMASWASAGRPRASSRPPRSSAWAARSRRASGSGATPSGSAPHAWAHRRGPRVLDRGPGARRGPRLRGDGCHARRPPRRGPVLRRWRPDHSLVMAYRSKEVRFLDTVHMFDRDRPPRVRL